jgi:exosome complex component CSL4
VVGFRDFDEEEKIARIQAVNRLTLLKEGDIVLGEVERVSLSMATISVRQLVGNSRAVTGLVEGVVHVSKVSKKFNDDVRKEYRAGDIIRAKVVQASPSLQLSTESPELGALKSRCLRCRATLEMKNGTLYCDRCERVEHRKLAQDYNEFTPEFRK